MSDDLDTLLHKARDKDSSYETIRDEILELKGAQTKTRITRKRLRR